jgi:hypothetical protein
VWGSDRCRHAHPRDPWGGSRGAHCGAFQGVLCGVSHGAGEDAGGVGGEDGGKEAPSTAIQTHHGRDWRSQRSFPGCGSRIGYVLRTGGAGLLRFPPLSQQRGELEAMLQSPPGWGRGVQSVSV